MRTHILISAAALFGLTAAISWGQLLDDPLHGFCTATTPAGACSDNGTNTPLPTNPATGFGFTISPAPQTGDFLIDILVPNDEQTAGATYAITGTQGGISNTSAISATAKLFSSTDWTSGRLPVYLGLNVAASPDNNITAYLPATQTFDSTATGFSVYQADLGQTTIQGNSPLEQSVGPQLNLGSSLPLGSYIVSFLNTGASPHPVVATANSGALFIDGPPSTVPEPTSWLLLGTFALGLVGLRWKVKKT